MNKIGYYLDEVDNVLAKRHQAPITAEVDPSNYCNNRCSFCCFESYLQENQVHLSYDLYLKFLREFRTLKGQSITFTGGGEPLMNPEFLRMAVAARDRGIEIGLVTNGTLLHTIAGQENLFRFIRVSLNAATPETYYKVHGTDSFSNVIHNLSRLMDLKDRPDVGISFVVCPDNEHEIEAIQAIGEKLQVDYVVVKPDTNSKTPVICNPKNKDRVIVSKVNKVDRDYRVACAVAGLIFQLGANGDVYYCCIVRGNEEFKLGNVANLCVSDFVKIREMFTPDTSQCNSNCRYIVYADYYNRYVASKYVFLRHKRFI